MTSSARQVTWLFLLAPTLVLAACRSTTAPPPQPGPTTDLAAPDAGTLESRAMLLLMADRRLYDSTALELMLSGPVEVRRQLAVTLGQIGDVRGRSLLQGLLVDIDDEVRSAAAFALGELGAPEARRALIVAAVDDDPAVGRLAVEALGKIGAPLAEVRRALGALEADEAWARLAPSLFRFREPATVDAAVEGLTRTELAVRAGSAYALGREPRPDGAEALRGLLTDDDPFVRAWAARGLGEVGGLGDLARLLPLLDDAELSPRVQAMRAGARLLARFEALPPLDWGDRLAAAVDDAQPGAAATAIEAAGRFLPHPELEARLRKALDDGEPRQRELALLALATGGVDDAAGLVTAAASAGERLMRARAAEAAARLGDLDTLLALQLDPEAMVRVAALEGLARGAGGALGDLVRRSLRDSDPTVRATALDLLAGEPVLAAAELAPVIDAERGERMNDARLAGIRALVSRGRAEESERAAVVEALLRLLEDEDPLARREAAAGLAGLGEARPGIGAAAPLHGLGYYRQVLLQTTAARRVRVVTERGPVEIELTCPQTPLTCLSFLQLAGQRYFDGLTFHRVVPDFVVQGGDPRGDGWGGPGYTLRDEVHPLRFERGVLGMALSGPDTGGSQFFLTLSPQPHLDGGFTAFGRVVSGLDRLDQIRQGDRILEVREIPGGGGPVR